MTNKLTPEFLKAALEAATPGPWLEHWDSEGSAFVSASRCVRATMTGPEKHKENARLLAMAPDLATAYLAQAKEIKRLRKRVEAADRLADDLLDLIAESGGVTGLHLNGDVAPWCDLLEGGRHEEWLGSLAAYRATEEQ